MSIKHIFLIAAALILFLSVPFLFYQFYDLNSVVNDPERCAAAFADFLEHTTGRYVLDERTKTIYCQHLGYDAWTFGYLAILGVLLGGGCLYTAFKRKNGPNKSFLTTE